MSIFFFNDTATTEIYTLSLHDALPICPRPGTNEPVGGVPERGAGAHGRRVSGRGPRDGSREPARARSEEHTSELQSPCNLVCRLLLEKKNTTTQQLVTTTSSYPVFRTP